MRFNVLSVLAFGSIAAACNNGPQSKTETKTATSAETVSIPNKTITSLPFLKIEGNRESCIHFETTTQCKAQRFNKNSDPDEVSGPCKFGGMIGTYIEVKINGDIYTNMNMSSPIRAGQKVLNSKALGSDGKPTDVWTFRSDSCFSEGSSSGVDSSNSSVDSPGDSSNNSSSTDTRSPKPKSADSSTKTASNSDPIIKISTDDALWLPFRKSCFEYVTGKSVLAASTAENDHASEVCECAIEKASQKGIAPNASNSAALKAEINSCK